VAALALALRAWVGRGWIALVADVARTSGVPVRRAVGALRRFSREVEEAVGFPVAVDDGDGRLPVRLVAVRRVR